ncbi:MAG TPA: hypothetical protein VLG68_09035 [Gammaproteobacteria bacterium]|nr:hypothetical protein [Gammaproteobacteria bacterium]
MDESWAAYIDEEGFASHWDETMEGFRGINAQMDAICRIGMKVYPNEVERLFCYQFGDAFLVTSDFHEPDLSRAVLIVIAILRNILSSDRLARATLVEGNIADIAGCYPKEIRDLSDRTRVALGAGLLMTTPILGQGLLRAVGLSKRKPKGPLFLVDSALKDRLQDDINTNDLEDGTVAVNWLLGEPKGLREIQEKAGLKRESQGARVARVAKYLTQRTLKNEWKQNVFSYLLP